MIEPRVAPPGNRSLVTGAGGFIGSHLARRIAEAGTPLRVLDLHLDRVEDLRGKAGFEAMVGDVADPEVQRAAVDGVDVVYHLAAAHLGVSAGDAEFRRVNVEGVRTLIDACRAAGVRRFVHCSSVGVFGHVPDPPVDEDAPCHPDLVYERTKLEGEGVVLDAVREHGFPAVILRPVWVYGPGCPRTEKLLRTVGRGRFVVAGDGAAMRHCVFIDDMVDAFLLAGGADGAVGRVLIVGDDEPVTVRRLVDEIAAVVGARPPRAVPFALLRAAALVAEMVFLPIGKEPPISRRTLRFFTGNTAFRIDRAREHLGFRPRYTLAEGLRETRGRIEAAAGGRR